MSRRGALTVEVTVSSFSSYVAFLEGYARALAAAETKWDRARTWLRDAISSTRIDLSADARVDPSGRGAASMRVAFPNARTDRDISRLAQEVFALPARLAETRRRKVVVALDEFQAIGGFNGGSVEHAMRAAVQHQREVGYVFAGSEPSADGADAHAQTSVLQGRSGHAPRQDTGRRIRRVHRRPLRRVRHASRAGVGHGDRRSRRQSALRRAASRARNVGRSPRQRAAGASRSTICIRR